MSPENQRTLRALLDQLDEAALVALANKGLVRRAVKDGANGDLTVEESDSALIVRGPNWTVTMPVEGPAEATDDTRSSGVTRQILTATLFLRDHWTPAAIDDRSADQATRVEAAATDEGLRLAEHVVRIAGTALIKWAGRPTLAEATGLLPDSADVEIQTGPALTIRLTSQDVEVRLFPMQRLPRGKGLFDKFHSNVPSSQHGLWTTVGVLALIRSKGLDLPVADSADAALSDPAGSPRTRAETLEATSQLLNSMLTTGITHVSGNTRQRLQTLSISAMGVNLPRLSRLLRDLTEEVELQLARHAAADASRLLSRMSTASALIAALQAAGARPPVELTGRHRTAYDPVGTLRMSGLGAWSWRTRSGFLGLTVLFFDAENSRFLTWSASRPDESLLGFHPTRVYENEHVWTGAGPPSELCRSHIVLSSARVNEEGRISASAETTAEVVGQSEPDSLEFGRRLFKEWGLLLRYAAATLPVGLRVARTLDRIVVVQPSRWGARSFDELHQRLVWEVEDTAGETLRLTVPWTPTTETSLQFLEDARPERDGLKRVVVQIRFNEHGAVFEPLALHRAAKSTQKTHDRLRKSAVLCPSFDAAFFRRKTSALLERLRQKYGRDRIETSIATQVDERELIDSIGSLGSVVVDRLLSRVEQITLRIAEQGGAVLNERTCKEVRDLSVSAEKLGLDLLSKSLAKTTADVGEPDPLRLDYLARLHRAAAVLPAAGE